MELNFKNNNGMYEAEFAASDAFNLNLVREKKGLISIFLKGASDGEYPTKASYRDIKAASVVDVDVTAAAYPKYIKIVSSSPVNKGTVTTDGEAIEIPSGNGGGGSSKVPLTTQALVNIWNSGGTIHADGWAYLENGKLPMSDMYDDEYLTFTDPNIDVLDMLKFGGNLYYLENIMGTDISGYCLRLHPAMLNGTIYYRQ